MSNMIQTSRVLTSRTETAYPEYKQWFFSGRGAHAEAGREFDKLLRLGWDVWFERSWENKGVEQVVLGSERWHQRRA